MKPEVQVIGEDGNVFAILARVSRALKRAGDREAARELQARVTSEAGSYEEALAIMEEYVTFK